MDDDDRVEEVFGRLLEAASTTLTPSQLDEVRHFLDHNEAGIALETLVAIYQEERKVAPEAVKGLIAATAREMEMRPEFLLRRLNAPGGPSDED